MSTEKAEVQTSPEDKFFGIRQEIDLSDKPGEKEGKAQIEIEEEGTPPEPAAAKPAPPPRPKKPESDDEDEELKSVSERVKKRINKLTWQAHEAERQRLAAEKLNEEAVRVTRAALSKNREYEQIINTGEARLVETIKSRAEMAMNAASAELARAHEEGDTPALVEAQKALGLATAEQREAVNYEQDYTARAHRFAQQQQFQPQQPTVSQTRPQAPQQSAVPKPTERSQQWAQDNPWFGPEKAMTALAYGVHEELVVNQGIRPDTDEYFETIDATMRSRFPEYFEQDQGEGGKPPASTAQPPPTVVAPAGRNNGAAPRKVKLNSTQVALAKKLGIPLEDYANEVFKLSQGSQS